VTVELVVVWIELTVVTVVVVSLELVEAVDDVVVETRVEVLVVAGVEVTELV
jgi:hypothetical protein